MAKTTINLSLDKDVTIYYRDLWHTLKLKSYSTTINKVLKAIMNDADLQKQVLEAMK